MWITNNEKDRILNLHHIDVLSESTVKQINVQKDKIYDTLSPVLKQNETYSGTLDGKSLHIEVGNDFIRTPLGGWINHSEDPNCERKQHNNRWFLKTTQDIDKNIELTLKYSMYKP